jgi:glycosyltransferase involved in cell wall biosynthesis
VYTVEIARRLARETEIELHLLARRGDGQRWSEWAPGVPVHALVPGSRPARLVWEQTRAPRVARDLGIDVWHGPHYTMPLGIDVPAVVTVHDMTFFDHPEWHERTKVAYFRRMIAASSQRAAVLLAVSEHTARRLTDLLHPDAPVVVASHGVDRERFRADADVAADLAALGHLGIAPPYLAFAGTLEPRKDVPTLIDAFARVAPDRPDLRLVVAGADGWGAAAVREAAARSGVTTRILRTGYFPGDALPALFRRAEAVVYPSLEEGFGLPALEAMACGTPVVTTTGSAMEEVVADAGRLVPPGEPAALAAAVTTVLDDAGEAARLRTAGPQRAAQFTWDASVRAHVDAYRTAAGVPA